MQGQLLTEKELDSIITQCVKDGTFTLLTKYHCGATNCNKRENRHKFITENRIIRLRQQGRFVWSYFWFDSTK